jgi:MYXO-CTERM domain-containing protein
MGDPTLLFRFTRDLTAAIALQTGAPVGEYLAWMQRDASVGLGGTYLSVRNEVRGIGAFPTAGYRETFDLNPEIQTLFPVNGVVGLNSVDVYLDPGIQEFARAICLLEFGHRWGPVVQVPAYPGGGPDAGYPPLSPGALLGRMNNHWSYFLNTGGSPLEGNDWEEVSPGVFHARPTPLRYSPLDEDLMGFRPADEVPPFWLIVDPDAQGQLDALSAPITPASPPELYDRDITILGRKVTLTIDDIIAANGPRDPAYLPPGTPVEPGSPQDPNLRGVWVVLARPQQVNDELADAFDQAVETCSGFWSDATEARSQLLAQVLPLPDGGPGDGGRGDGGPRDATSSPDAVEVADGAAADAGPDAARDAATDAGRAPDGVAGGDAGTGGAGGGGCNGCRTSGAGDGQPAGSALLLLVALLIVRRRRHARQRTLPGTLA